MATNTDDIADSLPRAEPEPVRFVDIHIYPLLDEDEQETKAIEAALDEISAANQIPDDAQELPTAQPGRKLSPILVVLVAILLLALVGKGYLYLVPLLTPTATITIIPTSHVVQVEQNVTITTGNATSNKNSQIPGRPLASLSLAQSATIPTTGHSHQDAQPAKGTITFYNSSPSAISLPVGLIILGKSGTSYTIDQPATIPGAVYPHFGTATIAAHTLSTGLASNQSANDVYGNCCLLNISAVSSAFVGGQDARDMQVVNEQDITGTADKLKASLTASASAALETQVQQGESLVAPSCAAQTTSNHQIGDEATQVTITVEQQCSTLAYQKDALQALMQRAITEQAMHQFGASYTQIGDSTVTIKGQQTDTTGTAVQVQARGVWYASFSTARLVALAQQMTGKSRQEANRFLLRTQGIAQIEGLPETLPTNPADIHILVLFGGGNR